MGCNLRTRQRGLTPCSVDPCLYVQSRLRCLFLFLQESIVRGLETCRLPSNVIATL